MSEALVVRARKLLGMATRSDGNAHENALAASRAFDTLGRVTLPLRYIVPAHTVCVVVPSQLLLTSDAAAIIKATRRIPARTALLYFEADRQRDAAAKRAFAGGYITFLRYGYRVLVPLTAVTLVL